MKYLILSLLMLFSSFQSLLSQEEPEVSIMDLSFLEGKWKAIATDSSFSTILEYVYSPDKNILFGYNHLYGKGGDLFAYYEGAYYSKDEKFVFFLIGSNGEIHEGIAYIENGILHHEATIIPGKGTKSYHSVMNTKDKRLYYYANYSREENIPESVDLVNPLVYDKL